MTSTVEWAKSLNISVESSLSGIEGYSELYPRTAYEVGVRAVILQGVVAVGYKVDPALVIEWFHEQSIWDDVTPQEKDFLLGEGSRRQVGR